MVEASEVETARPFGPLVAYRTHLGHGKRFAERGTFWNLCERRFSRSIILSDSCRWGSHLEYAGYFIYEWVEWHVNLGRQIASTHLDNTA